MRYFLLLLLSVISFVSSGEERTVPGRRFGGNEQSGRRWGGFNRSMDGNRSGDNSRERGRGNMMAYNQFFVELEIARKFPEEYAKVDAIRKEYEAKLAELAQKASVTLPVSRDAAYRKLREADRAGFDAAVEKMKTSPREGMMQMMELARKSGIELFGRRPDRRDNAPAAPAAQPDSKRVFDRPDMAKLRKKYPEKMQKYDELRLEDREKARKMLLEIIEADKSGEK